MSPASLPCRGRTESLPCRHRLNLPETPPLLEADCAEELQQLRSCLQGTQEQEAAQVAALCSSAVERAVLLIHPGMTEWEASGVLSGCAVANGLIPNVLFTPADEHIARYRHALSGPYPLKKR